MPTKDYASPAQARLMRARAHGWKPDKPRGRLPSAAVAKEFVDVKDRGKPKKMQIGGAVRGALEEAQRQQTTGLEYTPSGVALGTEPISDEDVGKRGKGLASTVKGTVGRAQLARAGWHLSGGMWYPPQGTLGYRAEGEPSGLGRVGSYALPTPAPEGMAAEPGSIAAEIYEKYGITDPTATRYDLTSQERMREDPLAHLEPGDPARQEYERWDFARQAQAPERGDPSSFYPEPSGMRVESPYRTQLREHKARIADILREEEEPVEMQFGGLASAVGSRAMNPRMMAQMRRRGAPGQRGRFGRPGRQTGGQRPMNPQMMARLRQMQQQRGRGRGMGMGMGMVAPGLRGGMRGQMPRTGGFTPSPGMGKQVGLGRPGMVQPGGPGGPIGGPPQMLGASRMPGGRAAPFRGLLNKQRQMQRTTPGGNRVGMRDQQGGLSRAMQTQTGRPPISRRAAFPGSRQNMY